MNCPKCGRETNMVTFGANGRAVCPKCKAAAGQLEPMATQGPTQKDLENFYRLHVGLCRALGVTEPGAIERMWQKETGTPPPAAVN